MIYFFPATLLSLMGYLIKYKKATWLISGYNTASKEKKQRYDTEALCKYTGNFIFILSGIFYGMAALSVFLGAYANVIAWSGFGVLAVTVLICIWYLNTGKCLKK